MPGKNLCINRDCIGQSLQKYMRRKAVERAKRLFVQSPLESYEFDANWRRSRTPQHIQFLLRGYDDGEKSAEKRIERLLRLAINGNPRQIRKAKDVLHRVVEADEDIVLVMLCFNDQSEKIKYKGYSLCDLVQNRMGGIAEKQDNDYSNC